MSMLSGLSQSDDILQQLIQAKRGQAKPAPGTPDPYSETPATPPGLANQPTMIGNSPAIWGGPAGAAKPAPKGPDPYSETPATRPGENKQPTMIGNQPAIFGGPAGAPKPSLMQYLSQPPQMNPPAPQMGAPVRPKATVPLPSFQPQTATPHGDYGANLAFPEGAKANDYFPFGSGILQAGETGLHPRNAMTDDNFKALLDADRATRAAPSTPPPTPKGATAIQPSGMTDVPLQPPSAADMAAKLKMFAGPLVGSGMSPTNYTFQSPGGDKARYASFRNADGSVGGGLIDANIAEAISPTKGPYTEANMRLANDPAMRNPSLGWSDEQRKNSLMSYLGMGEMGVKQGGLQLEREKAFGAPGVPGHLQTEWGKLQELVKQNEYMREGLGRADQWKAQYRAAHPGISEDEVNLEYGKNVEANRQAMTNPPGGKGSKKDELVDPAEAIGPEVSIFSKNYAGNPNDVGAYALSLSTKYPELFKTPDSTAKVIEHLKQRFNPNDVERWITRGGMQQAADKFSGLLPGSYEPAEMRLARQIRQMYGIPKTKSILHSIFGLSGQGQ